MSNPTAISSGHSEMMDISVYSDPEEIADSLVLEQVAKQKNGGCSQLDPVARFKATRKPLTLGNLHELIMALPLGKLCETTFQQRWAGEMLMILARYLSRYDPTSWCYLFEANVLTDKSTVSGVTDAPDYRPDLKKSEKPSWYGVMSDVLAKYFQRVDKSQRGTCHGFIKRKMQLRSSSGGIVTGTDLHMIKFADIVCGFVTKLYYSQAQEGYDTDAFAVREVLGKAIWAGYSAAKSEFKAFFEQKLILIDEWLIDLYPHAETAEKEKDAVIVTHFDIEDDNGAVGQQPKCNGKEEAEQLVAEKKRYPKRYSFKKPHLDTSFSTPLAVRGDKRRQFFNVDEEIKELEKEADVLAEQRDNCERQLKLAEDKLAECQSLLIEAQEKKKKQQLDAKIVVELRSTLPAENFEETSHIAIKTVGRIYNAYKQTTATPSEAGYIKYCEKVLNTVEADLHPPANKKIQENDKIAQKDNAEIPLTSVSALKVIMEYQKKRDAEDELKEGKSRSQRVRQIEETDDDEESDEEEDGESLAGEEME